MTLLPSRLYGVFIGASFVLAFVVVRGIVRRDDRLVHDRAILPGLAFVAVAVGVAAARIGVLLFEPEYVRRPWLLVWPFDEQMNFVGLRGMSFHTGLVAGLFASYLYLRVYSDKARRWINAVAIGLVCAYGVASIGSFATGDSLGRITSVPWAPVLEGAPGVPATFPPAQRIAAGLGLLPADSGTLLNLPRHPYQIYKTVLIVALLAVVARRAGKGIGPGKAGGRAFAWVLAGLGFVRALAGFFAVPMRGTILLVEGDYAAAAPHWLPASAGVITLDQLLSVAVALAGLVVWIIQRRADLSRPRVDFLEPDLGLDWGGTAWDATDRNRPGRGR